MTVAYRTCRAAWLKTGLLIGCLAGCNGAPPAVTSGTKPSAPTGTEAATNKVSPVDDMLQSAMYHLQPENIDTDGIAVVSVLNDWMQQASTFDPDKYGLTETGRKSIPDHWLSAEQLAQLLKPQFTVSDAVYVRNALLTASMARYATALHQGELDRVIDLFEFTLRTVSLQPPGLPQLPFPLNEILLLGQGTPDDRAWVFAALLKQQRIDAVILQAKDDPEARLVGVILDSEVYLFDTRLGLPIPRGDDPASQRIDRPATIRELQAHPEWWQPLTLRADQPYAWNSEQLATADVFVFSAEESWNGRMQQLESVLPPESTCALHDPLVDTAAQPSLAKRVLAGHSDWTAEKLRLWSHPLNVRERVQQMGPQAQQLSLIFQRLRAPLDVIRQKKVRVKEMNEDAVDVAMGRVNPFRDDKVFDMDGEKKIAPSDLHWKTRIEQLMGKFPEAMTHYHRIRYLALETPPQELNDPREFQTWNQLYQLAAVDASYWSAAAKIEQHDDEAAEGALRDFLRKYFRSNWASAAQYQLALTLARLKKFSDAASVIAALPPDDPHRPGLEILQKHWAGLDEKKPEPEKKTEPEQKPESDDTPEEKPKEDAGS